MNSSIASRTAFAGVRPTPSVVRMLGNETSKGLILLWDNRRTILPELGVLLVFYFLIEFLVGGGRVVQALYAPTLLAFSFYALLYIVTLKMVAGTLEEMNAGTLEQIHLSPLPSWALSLCRLASAAIEAAAVTGAVAGALILLLGIRLSYQLAVVLPVVLTLIDVAGFALLLGALAIRVSSIGAILHVLQGIVVFLNGSFVPVNLYPGWLQLVARLVPTTLGVEVTRRLLLQGGSLASTWSDRSLLWLLVHSGAMLVLGALAYQFAVRRALRDGRLGPR
ncbi:MAG TPA: ABC transporter permease [Candidatus Dormibacteraeota bacterium]|nr:ABC transporter permease [Candidatus Dormibacteraeota bacterium]